MSNLERFSNRVENYIRFRPGYPQAVVDLAAANGLPEHGIVADIGSGTGISSEIFLTRGYTVYGIEPNLEMRAAAERLLGSWKTFHSVNASAESTTLPDRSVDAVIAGQSFHWFDRDKARTEFRRIVRQGGKVFLIWNERRTESNEFLRMYEDFIRRFANDYNEVNHKNINDEVFDDFFGKGKYTLKSVSNMQHLDFERLKGRVFSSSYMPSEKDCPEAMVRELHDIFERFQRDGRVTIEYDTKIYYGTIA